jgi:hypothetical protein
LPPDIAGAQNPLAVYLGLPDDYAAMGLELDKAHEVFVSRCMATAGLSYVPVFADDPESGMANAAAFNAMSAETRTSYLAALHGTGSEGGCFESTQIDAYANQALADEWNNAVAQAASCSSAGWQTCAIGGFIPPVSSDSADQLRAVQYLFVIQNLDSLSAFRDALSPVLESIGEHG